MEVRIEPDGNRMRAAYVFWLNFALARSLVLIVGYVGSGGSDEVPVAGPRTRLLRRPRR